MSRKSSLAGSVRTYDTNDAVRRKHEVEVVEQNFLAERLPHVLRLYYLVAETRTVGDEYLQFLLALLLLLV